MEEGSDIESYMESDIYVNILAAKVAHSCQRHMYVCMLVNSSTWRILKMSRVLDDLLDIKRDKMPYDRELDKKRQWSKASFETKKTRIYIDKTCSNFNDCGRGQ